MLKTSTLVLLLLIYTALAIECPETNKEWRDSETASRLWQIMHDGDMSALKNLLDGEPCLAQIRAADGRGPLFWAHEFNRQEAISLLTSLGAEPEAQDRDGKVPREMVNANTAQQQFNAKFKAAEGVQVINEQYTSGSDNAEQQRRVRETEARKQAELEARRLQEEEAELLRAAKEKSRQNVNDEL